MKRRKINNKTLRNTIFLKNQFCIGFITYKKRKLINMRYNVYEKEI